MKMPEFWLKKKKVKKAKTVAVRVVVYIDGKKHVDYENKSVEAWAADFVSNAAVVQVHEPDYDLADEWRRDSGRKK